MRRSIRRILFWLLFCLFFITAPVAILYSQGYRFDQYRMIFVHSGSITVKSEPAQTNIYLNGELQKAKKLNIINDSVTISGLRPGNYTLRVSAEGYNDWEKTVGVHSGIASEYWNVTLAPSAPELHEVESNNVVRFFPSPFGKKIAFVRKEQEGFSLWVTDVSENKSALVAPNSDAGYLNTQLENIEWNFKEELLAVPVLRNEKKDYLVANSEQDFSPFFLSELGSVKNPGKVRWSSRQENVAYFTAESIASQTEAAARDLYTVDITSRTIKKMLSDVSAFDVSGDFVYFLLGNNVLFRSNLLGESITQVSSNPLFEGAPGEKVRLIVYDEDRQALLLDNGDLIVHNQAETEDTTRKIGESIRGVQFSDDGKKLLLWNSNEIFVLYLRKWDVQPFRNENELESIVRLSLPVANVFWYHDYEHVFFSTDSKIRLIELDARDRRNCTEILTNNTAEFSATYDSNEKLYYFLREQAGEKKIFFLELPQERGIFG